MWINQAAIGKPILAFMCKDHRIIDSGTALINAQVLLVKYWYSHLVGDNL